MRYACLVDRNLRNFAGREIGDAVLVLNLKAKIFSHVVFSVFLIPRVLDIVQNVDNPVFEINRKASLISLSVPYSKTL